MDNVSEKTKRKQLISEIILLIKDISFMKSLKESTKEFELRNLSSFEQFLKTLTFEETIVNIATSETMDINLTSNCLDVFKNNSRHKNKLLNLIKYNHLTVYINGNICLEHKETFFYRKTINYLGNSFDILTFISNYYKKQYKEESSKITKAISNLNTLYNFKKL